MTKYCVYLSINDKVMLKSAELELDAANSLVTQLLNGFEDASDLSVMRCEASMPIKMFTEI